MGWFTNTSGLYRENVRYAERIRFLLLVGDILDWYMILQTLLLPVSFVSKVDCEIRLS